MTKQTAYMKPSTNKQSRKTTQEATWNGQITAALEPVLPAQNLTFSSANQNKVPQRYRQCSPLFYFFSVVTCKADNVLHAVPSTSETVLNYNTPVTYTCETGYRLTSGDGRRICTANGTFSGKPPVCTSKS